MCGIAGIYNANGKPVLKSQIERMNETMIHRGPDGEGVFIDKNLGLGHRRLAIIDLSEAGHQPMSSEKKDVWISYNGEVYNFLDLRKKLEKRGHKFKSRTDTEVVLHAYEEWGIGCVKKFNGMFAFALWDEKKRKLFLVRDRYGIKPLYYYRDADKIIFASEIKAILENKGIPREVCPEALKEYFTFQNIYSDKTLFDKIKLLTPASILEVDRRGKVKISRYWDFKFKPKEISYKESGEKLERIFEKAVESQLVSDVTLGSYLSGGMDTGSIVAIASRHLPHFLTFTGGFNLSAANGIEMAFDERKEAELMANTFKTQAYQMIIQPGDMARIMSKLIWHLEDPRVGMTYQNYYISELASHFVKVVLGGTGGDEVFGGYPWRYKLATNSKNINEFENNYFHYWQRLVKEEEQKEFFSDAIYKKVKDYSVKSVFKDVLKTFDNPAEKKEEFLNRALYFEAKTFLPGLLLMEDKINMAHSLESRVPFLDNNLVDFALSLPVKYKVDLKAINKNNSRNSLGGKKILREAVKDLIPQKILHKEKKGFSPPDASWYRGSSMDYVKDIILDKKTLNRGYFKPKFIKKIVEDHFLGKANNRLIIWSLLCFEWWNRIFIDK